MTTADGIGGPFVWLGMVRLSIIALLWISAGAMAQVDTARAGITAPPAAQTPADAVATTDTPSVHGPLHRAAGPAVEAKGLSDAPEPRQFSMTRMLLSLGLVVAVILALRWGGVRVFGGAGAVKTSQVMHVVSRSIISPKQQLILVQVGRRLVMVGNSGTHLSSLTEITDADEVAELLGQAQRDKNDTISKTFGSWMRKAGMNFNGEVEAEATTEAEAADRRYAAEREEWTTAPDDPPGEAAPVERPHPELAGLLGKVRGMSDQFRSP